MRKDILIAVIAVIVIAAVAFGLSTMSRDLPLTSSKPFGGKKASTNDKNGPSADKVVMHVNGEAISEQEFNAYLLAAPEQSRALYTSPAGRRALADEVVKLKALEQEARRLGIDKDPEVQSQVDMMRAQITAGRALEKLVSERAEQKVRAAYEKERQSTFVLRHIAVAYEGSTIPARNQKPLSERAAMAKAQEIVKRLRGGADFSQTAQAESDDTQSAQQGGLLGPTKTDKLPQMLGPEIGGAVSKLARGQVSEPLKTQYAVHIFRTDDASIEDLRPMLLQEMRQEIIEAEIGRLHKSAKVELDPKFFPPQATPAPSGPGSAKPNP